MNHDQPHCTYCGRRFFSGPGTRPVIEHVEPRGRGGADTGENTVRACQSCNSSKGNLLLLEWVWKQVGPVTGGHGRSLRVDNRSPRFLGGSSAPELRLAVFGRRKSS